LAAGKVVLWHDNPIYASHDIDYNVEH